LSEKALSGFIHLSQHGSKKFIEEHSGLVDQYIFSSHFFASLSWIDLLFLKTHLNKPKEALYARVSETGNRVMHYFLTKRADLVEYYINTNSFQHSQEDHNEWQDQTI
jgi:hypothetical protein